MHNYIFSNVHTFIFNFIEVFFIVHNKVNNLLKLKCQVGGFGGIWSCVGRSIRIFNNHCIIHDN